MTIQKALDAEQAIIAAYNAIAPHHHTSMRANWLGSINIHSAVTGNEVVVKLTSKQYRRFAPGENSEMMRMIAARFAALSNHPNKPSVLHIHASRDEVMITAGHENTIVSFFNRVAEDKAMANVQSGSRMRYFFHPTTQAVA